MKQFLHFLLKLNIFDRVSRPFHKKGKNRKEKRRTKKVKISARKISNISCFIRILYDHSGEDFNNDAKRSAKSATN